MPAVFYRISLCPDTKYTRGRLATCVDCPPCYMSKTKDISGSLSKYLETLFVPENAIYLADWLYSLRYLI
jgi:hypothetical protein